MVKLKMIDIYGSFMQNPSRANKMADKSETRLFELYNAILMKSLKITQSKRAQKNYQLSRGVKDEEAMRTKHKLEIKLRPTANYANCGTILAETYTLSTSLL